MNSPVVPSLSIIVTAYNEQDCIPALYERITRTCRQNGYEYELILVDDGSTDGTRELILEAARKDPQVVPVILQRNFGQTAAMSAGIDHARLPLIVTMDADLQNDPDDIPMLLDVLKTGYDVVSGWRRNREDSFFYRKVPSWVANVVIGKVTGVRLHDYGCSLKIYRSSLLKRVRLYGELHRFIPALCGALGASIAEAPVRHHARIAGQSKYGIGRTFRVIIDLLTVKFLLSYSTRPMHFFGAAAALSTLAACICATATVAMKVGPTHLSMNRNPLMYLCIFLGMAGVQFLAVGLVAELVMRTYFEAQNKPVYVLRDWTHCTFASRNDVSTAPPSATADASSVVAEDPRA